MPGWKRALSQKKLVWFPAPTSEGLQASKIPVSQTLMTLSGLHGWTLGCTLYTRTHEGTNVHTCTHVRTQTLKKNPINYYLKSYQLN